MGRYDPRSIDRVARAIEDIADLEAGRQALLDALLREFEWTGGSWWAPNAEDAGWRCVAAGGDLAPGEAGERLAADTPPLDEARDQGELVLLEESLALPQRLRAREATAVAVIPMGEGHFLELILSQSRHLGASSRGILAAAGEAAARAYRAAQRLAEAEARASAALPPVSAAREDDAADMQAALEAAEARAAEAEARAAEAEARAAEAEARSAEVEERAAEAHPEPCRDDADGGWGWSEDGDGGADGLAAQTASESDASEQWITLLKDLGVSLSTSWDTPSTLSQALMALAEVLGWRWGAAWLWRSQDQRLRTQLFYGEEAELEAATAAEGLEEDGEDDLRAAWADGMPRWSQVGEENARDQAALAAGLVVRVCVPIVVGESRVGLLESYAPTPPAAGIDRVLQVLQQMVADRLQQLRLERRSTDLSMLPTMAGMIIDALSGLETAEAVWTATAAALNDLIWADVMAVMFMDGDTVRVSMPADHVDEISPEVLATGALEGLPGSCLRDGEIINIGDLQPDCAWSTAIKAEDFSTVVCVPVPCERIPPAALLLLWREPREPDSYWQNAMMEAGRIVAQVCDQVAVRSQERAWTVGVQRIMGLLDRIAAGDIEERLEGPMVEGLVGMRDNVHRIAQTVEDFQNAIAELTMACASGDLKRRTNADQFEGAWASVVVGVNQMMDVMERPISVVAARLERLSRGQDAQAIEDAFQGDFGKLAEATNSLITTSSRIRELTEQIAQGDLSVRITPRAPDDRLLLSLGSMVGILEQFRRAIAGLIRACASGDLSASADERGFQGAFAEMVGGMNAAIAAVAGPTQEAVEVLSRLAVGAQPPALRGSYAGDFKRLAGAINGLLQTNNEIADLAERIARGDLTVEVKERSADDRLLSSLGRMVSELNDALAQLDRRAIEVSGGSEQVETSSRALSENAVQAAASASQMKDTTEGLRLRTRENAERAERARACTRVAAEASESGAEQMNQMLTVMRQIEEESSRIGNIVRVIDEIAFQTNLLALNAAVEAARAGNHGKGFAVVAEEVRNLAARSATAAKEIGQVINTSMHRTERGVFAAEASATSLQGILSATREASTLVHNIAEASDEQRQSIDALYSGINRLDNVIQSNSAQSEEMAAAAVEMNGQVRAMKDLLGRFALRQEIPALPPALAGLPPELLQRLIQAMQLQKQPQQKQPQQKQPQPPPAARPAPAAPAPKKAPVPAIAATPAGRGRYRS